MARLFHGDPAVEELQFTDAELKWLRARLAGTIDRNHPAEGRRILRMLTKVHWLLENYTTQEAYGMLLEMRSGRGYNDEFDDIRGPKPEGFTIKRRKEPYL